jgi:hypothetical protein
MRLASCDEFEENKGLEPWNTISLLSSLFERAHVTPLFPFSLRLRDNTSVTNLGLIAA